MGAVILTIALWAVHFTVIYGFAALACARQMSGAVPWVVGVASAVATIALIAIAFPAAMRLARAVRFADFVTLGLGGLAMLAVLWEASALVWVPACA
jgi:hypothetical protein